MKFEDDPTREYVEYTCQVKQFFIFIKHFIHLNTYQSKLLGLSFALLLLVF